VRNPRISPRGRITYYDDNDPHAVYRIFDRLSRVIYIGSSHAPTERIETHRTEAKWRGEIFRAVFRCVACGHQDHADVNAAKNILAAGLAVTGRGDLAVGQSVKRQPPVRLAA